MLTRRKAVEPAVETRDGPLYTMVDPAFASWLFGPQSSGVLVTSDSALSVPALWSAVSLLSTTVASLPMKVYRDANGERLEVLGTWVDKPNPWMSTSSFKQLLVTHMALDGNAFLLHIYGGAGQIVGLQPISPWAVTVEWDKKTSEKLYKVSVDGEQREFGPADLTHIHGLSTDGLRGLSPVYTLRNAIGTAIAGNEAAARSFNNGGMISGIVTSEEDVDADEAKLIKADLDSRITGVQNTGAIAFVNRTLKFTPWMMHADEAQFIEQREFSVEEIARIYRVPKVLLASDGASTWGAGIQELNRGLARYTLPAYIKPIEDALSALLAAPRWVEFEMKGLLQATPEEEIRLLIEQVQAGLLTVDEARQIMNRPPLTPEEAPDGSEEI